MMHYNLLLVYLSLSTKNASSPDPGYSIGAKCYQTVQNFEKLPRLCFFLLETLHKCFVLASILGTPTPFRLF